ncbi:MAG TPA: 5'-methylthioadenosine/S-adenosylhomocysteine nucleosidase [Myxococcales bacterium]|jgi:nucleoside phosphorylase
MVDVPAYTSEVASMSMKKAIIVTALPSEYQAVRAHLTDLREKTHPRGTVYEIGIFGEGPGWQVLIVQVGQGNIPTATHTERAIEYFNPDIIMFAGVAGGIKDVALGDVVASTKVYGYESGKDYHGFKPRPHVGNASHTLIQRAQAESRKSHWKSRILPQDILQTFPSPVVYVAPIASGEKIVADRKSDLAKFLKAIYGDALAVEMEGIGLLDAVQACERVQAIVVRGISDQLHNKAEADGAQLQPKAAGVAAAFAFHILSTVIKRDDLPATDSHHSPSSDKSLAKHICPPRATNLLGEARAEADKKMLAQAYFETADYRAITGTESFQYVVGRRGTGKSALYQRAVEQFSSDKSVRLVAEKPSEHDILVLQSAINSIAKQYREQRAVARLVWKLSILMEASTRIVTHFKAAHLEQTQWLLEYNATWKHLSRCPSMSERARQMLATDTPMQTMASTLDFLVANYQLGTLTDKVRTAMAEIGIRVVVMFDGIDEGWEPTALATSIVGGLAQTAADLSESAVGIHTMLFVRDNIYRSLAHLDTDFSRHIEPHSLRLHWDEQSLLPLVAQRLRIALNLPMENDIRVWNRFAKRDLADRDGFRYCLRHTLYRPRDLLVLLNSAYMVACRAGREAILEADIEQTAKAISQDRLADLLKEYDEVLPGLRLFVEVFRGRSSRTTIREALTLIEQAIARSDYREMEARDFALLGSGREVLSALYSVGFLGLFDGHSQRYLFCHDGAPASVSEAALDDALLVHPCYWKALDMLQDEGAFNPVIDVPFDFGEVPHSKNDLIDQRVRRSGEIIGELSAVPLGDEGDSAFEKWVHSVTRILFMGRLSDIQLAHTPGGGRHTVASNIAVEGVWSRLRNEFSAANVRFIPFNRPSLVAADIDTISDIMRSDDGRIVFAVCRSNITSLSDIERDAIAKLWESKSTLLVIQTSSSLSHCLRKLKAKRKKDYTEDVFAKDVDQLLSMLEVKHRRFRKKK